MQKSKLYLIDGSSYIYRAFHAIPFLSNKKGLPTNAIYGFTVMLKKVLKDFCPSHLALVFDTKAPSFRHKLYEEYKAQRPEMPDSLKPQLPYIKEIVHGFNIPCLEMEGYEADDVIGTITRKAQVLGYQVVIVTGDKDMLQLVSKDVTVVDTMKDKIYGTKEVIERFGVLPSRIVDIMALAGDAIDNVPGVKGIGEKTAQSLIKEFFSLENLLANLDKVKNKKVRESLETHIELARLSRKLVEIIVDAPVDVDYEGLNVKEPDNDRLKELFRELEFNKLLKETEDQRPKTENQRPVKIVLTQNDLDSLAAELKSPLFQPSAINLKPFALSLEPTSHIPHPTCFYIPFAHHYSPIKTFEDMLGAPEQMKMKDVLNSLKPFFEDESIKKRTDDAKGSHLILMDNSISIKGIEFDAGIALYLLNEDGSGVRGQGSGVKNLNEIDIETSAQYLCEYTARINELAEELLPRLKDEGLEELYNTIELPLAEVLAYMESTGIKVDRVYLSAFGIELQNMLAEIQKRIYRVTGIEFNINSPKQLAEVLFEKLKLKPIKKTKTGYSTDEEVLTKLALSHELPQEVLNYRQLSKLKSTYVDGILSLINIETGRVHTSFNAISTATGRLTSKEPNLQNIPIKTELGRRIRKAFIPDEGFIFISFDYSQIELRLAAHLSGDMRLVKSFQDDEDIHAKTAGEIFGIDVCMVTDEMRRKAKAINFGIIYGMGEYGLSQELGISNEEAREYITRYFSVFSGVKAYIDSVINETKERGYAVTIFGRRRYIPELNSEIESVRRFGERIAVNTPVQGSAADLIKLAMIRIYNRFKQGNLKSRMLLQIHDELLFEVSEDERTVVEDMVKYEMENAIKLSVPVKVNIGKGKNWMEAG